MDFVFIDLEALFCGFGGSICLFQSLSLSVQPDRMLSDSQECRFNLHIFGFVDFSIELASLAFVVY